VAVVESVVKCTQRHAMIGFQLTRAHAALGDGQLDLAKDIATAALAELRASKSDADAGFYIDRFSFVLAEIAEYSGELHESLAHLAACAAFRRRVLGATDADTVAVELQTGATLRLLKRYDEAIGAFRGVVDAVAAAVRAEHGDEPSGSVGAGGASSTIRTQLQTAAHTQLLKHSALAQSSIAACLMDAGRGDEAERRLCEACAFCAQAFGPKARDTIDAWRFLATLIDRRAQQHEEQQKQIAQAQAGSENVVVASPLPVTGEAAAAWERVASLQADFQQPSASAAAAAASSAVVADDLAILASDLERAIACRLRGGEWALAAALIERAISALQRSVAAAAAASSVSVGGSSREAKENMLAATAGAGERVRALRDTLAQCRRALGGSDAGAGAGAADAGEGVVDESLTRLLQCAGCARIEERPRSFQVCSACKAAVFCSNECFRAAWKTHKVECRKV
jgi:hypothetical protein